MNFDNPSHTLVAPTSAHSQLVGGSSAERFIHCPGARALQAAAPPKAVGEAAHRGSALHHLIDDHLTNPMKPYAPTRVILEEAGANGEDLTVEVSQAMIDEKIRPALEWFDHQLTPRQFWSEVPLRFGEPLNDAFGTADILFISDTRAGIIDWKFGDGVLVSAKDNTQLKFYLAAAVLDNPWFAELTTRAGIFTFDAYIVQPRAGETDIVSHTELTVKELVEFRAALVDAKQRLDDGDTTLNVGSWCQFCAAQTTCPAWRTRAQDAIASLVQADCEALTIPEQVAQAAQTFSTAALRDAYLEATELSKWANAVKDHVRARFAAGQSVEGLKQVRCSQRRSWVEPKTVENWLRRRGLHVADYRTKAELKSVAQIEKMVADPLVPDHIRYQDVHMIVSEDDPRPAVEPPSSS